MSRASRRLKLLPGLTGAVIAGAVVGIFLLSIRESDGYGAALLYRYVLYAVCCYLIATVLVYVPLYGVGRQVLKPLLAAAVGSLFYFFAINLPDELIYDFVPRVVINAGVDTAVSFPIMLTVHWLFHCPNALVKTMHLRCKTLVATHVSPC
jgi:hypothetical protein